MFPISAVQKQGFKELLWEIENMLKELPADESFEDDEEDIYSSALYEQPFEITLDGDVYVVSGPVVDRLLDSVNLNDNESLQYFQRMLRRRGIIDALREKGIKDGDTVRIRDVEFDYID